MTAIVLFLLAVATSRAESHGDWPAAYNIVWTNQSDNSLGSMPCGAGNLGLNVWVEKNDLLIYIGSPDAWSDRGLLTNDTARWCGQVQTKIGRLRIHFTPAVLANDFRQELDLANNAILVSGRSSDGNQVKLKIWVDAFQPVVHVAGAAERPLEVLAAMEFSRGDARMDGDTFEWWQRNAPADEVRASYIKEHKLESLAPLIPDPMANRTFGGRLSGRGFVAQGMGDGSYAEHSFQCGRLKSRSPAREFELRATLRIAQDTSLQEWRAGVTKLEAQTAATSAKDWKRTENWWREFWNRSHIIINSGKESESDAWRVGRNYQLFRAMLACNQTGEFPTLFNGGHFLCENDPDTRNWGATQFMSQNQRLVYWPMLKDGDYDLLKVALEFYRRHIPLQQAWAKHFWQVDGLAFPEELCVYGVEAVPGGNGRSILEHLAYHHISGMEFALMGLDYASYSGGDVRPYLPLAEGYVHYYDEYYRRENRQRTGKELDDNSHLVIFPGNAIEMYQGTRNDACSISGLAALCDALTSLPAEVLPPDRRAYYDGFRKTLPPLPTCESRGHRVLAPAESWRSKVDWDNIELPEMYPVFPFHNLGIGLPGLDLARDTWAYSYINPRQRRNFCWYQSLIYTADLGLADEAREFALGKFLWPEREVPQRDSGMRYPAFYDTFGFCQRPDMDHGGCAMIGLQEMLLQTPGGKIYLLPAWPKEWDVDFKLHAPGNTTVECVYQNGKVVKLQVTPKSRAKDVVLP